MKCMVEYCGRNSRHYPELSFMRFPSDDTTKSKWIEFCRLDHGAVEIKPSSRICSAHFKEACFRTDVRGNRWKNKNAVPSIEAFLLLSDDEPEESNRMLDFYKSRPLYSSPALQDHNYANFVAVVPDWVDIEDQNTEEEFASNQGVVTNEPDSAAAEQIEIEVKVDPVYITACQEENQSDSRTRIQHEKICVGSREKRNSFQLFRVANKWQERAKKWKKDALYWKNKYSAASKSAPILQKLKTIYRKDQMDVVLGKVKKVRKWTNETLVEGLQTRFACGRGYDKVRQLPYVALPSYSCLLSKIKSVHFDTGILHEVFELLKHKVSTMSGSELDCGIILDEMSVDEANEFCTNNQKYFGTTTLPISDELATHGLVFMLAGIHIRWKQIVAYEFTGNSIPKGCLKQVVEELILKAESIGLRVHFVTSDCGACNKSMWQDFGVSTKKTTIDNDLSIEHPVDANRRLEFIPDPVHIFKSSVNGWIANTVITLPPWYLEQNGLTNNEVHRDHLKYLVTHERDQNLKMAHKLTEADVDFENNKTSKVDKMKVSKSTRYCNHSVAAALNVLSDDPDFSYFKSTALLLKDLARWFDLMSSRKDEDALKVSDRDGYESKINHLRMMVKLVSEIKVGSDGHWKPWQAALVMATKAILRLQDKLFSDGYSVLYTSRFTQDCVENLFSVVRSKQRRPTPLQFKSHLRTITLSQYMQEVRNSSYNMDDREYLSGFIDHLKTIEQSSPTQSSINLEKSHDFSKVEPSTMAKQTLSNLNNAEANALFHVAGYIMGSISKNSITCSSCIQGCITAVPFDKNYSKFSSLVANARGKPYAYVSEDIFNFFTCMDCIYNEHFTNKSETNKNLIIHAQNTMTSIPLKISNCHNVKFKLVKRFLQFRMKSDRVRKMRKQKFDSRSMLN